MSFDLEGCPVRLNAADRFAYAPAEAPREPLLIKGEELARIDLAAA